MLEITSAERRALRAKAHHLDPVVSIGQHGLTPPVMQEIDRALAAHALVKVRVHSDARAERDAMLVRIADELAAAPVQHLGKLLIVWRPLPVDKAPAVATPAAPRHKPAKERGLARRRASAEEDRSSVKQQARRRGSRRVDQRPSDARDDLAVGRSRKSASGSGAPAGRRPGAKKPRDDIASRRESTAGSAPGQRKRGASSAPSTPTNDDRRRRGASFGDSAGPRGPGKPARRRSTTPGSGSPSGSGSSSRRRDGASGASAANGGQASRRGTRTFKTAADSSASTGRPRGGASGAKGSPSSFNPRRRRRG
jgi:putative YhbY family RNA-binding protein